MALRISGDKTAAIYVCLENPSLRRESTKYSPGACGSAHPVAGGWVAVGVLAALAGLAATVLGSELAFVVAYQWLGFEIRVQAKLDTDLQHFKHRLDMEMRQRLQSIGELLAMALTGFMMPEDRQQLVMRLLARTPDIPNAAALVAQMFLNACNDDPIRSADHQEQQAHRRERALY